MINTIGDLITEVLVRNNRQTTDSFVTDTMLMDWAESANTWATSLYKWPFTEGRQSTTYTTAVTDENGLPYTPYPEGWKIDSIRILTIGGKRLQKTEFASFLKFLEENPGSTERIFTDYNRQIYVNVRADVSGTMTAYGIYTPIVDATDLTAKTVFSGYDEEANEALVEKMTAYLKTRERSPKEAKDCEEKAIALLGNVWGRVKDEQYAYQPKDQSMFERFDVLGGEYASDEIKRNQF